MSHPAQLRFIEYVKSLYPYMFRNRRVLEVGSLDLNGSVRQFFSGCEYVGIDVGPGNGVDEVCEGQLYAASDGYFDVAISCECFEHNPHWEATLHNMVRLVPPSGLVIATCATEGRLEHGTTRSKPEDSPLTLAKGWDYYKNLTEDDFRRAINIDDRFIRYEFAVDKSEWFDLYFWGAKR